MIRHGSRALTAALGVTLLFSGACTRRLLDFTVISSKNVNMPIPQSAKSSTRVTGRDMVFVILGIPLGTPSLKEALDRAIESAGPGYDALIDGVLYQKGNPFQMGMEVTGTAVKTSTLKAAMGDVPILYHSSLARSNENAIKRLGINEAPATEPESGQKP